MYRNLNIGIFRWKDPLCAHHYFRAQRIKIRPLNSPQREERKKSPTKKLKSNFLLGNRLLPKHF